MKCIIRKQVEAKGLVHVALKHINAGSGRISPKKKRGMGKKKPLTASLSGGATMRL